MLIGTCNLINNEKTLSAFVLLDWSRILSNASYIASFCSIT